jgi:hypothetical protein
MVSICSTSFRCLGICSLRSIQAPTARRDNIGVKDLTCAVYLKFGVTASGGSCFSGEKLYAVVLFFLRPELSRVQLCPLGGVVAFFFVIVLTTLDCKKKDDWEACLSRSRWIIESFLVF